MEQIQAQRAPLDPSQPLAGQANFANSVRYTYLLSLRAISAVYFISMVACVDAVHSAIQRCLILEQMFSACGAKS